MQIETFTLGPFQTNCFVVTEGEACVVVDVGMQPGVLLEHLEARGLVPGRVVLTHAHSDHIAGVDELRGKFPGVEVAVHPSEAGWLGDPAMNLSLPFGLPMTVGPAEATIDEGDVVAVGAARFEVLHTPGHSPGGVTLYCEAEGVAIVGDTLFAGSVGRTDFPTSDPAGLIASIREKLYALPDDTVCYPGHGPTTTIGREKASNPFVTA
ncbi:MAG: MBL fold metallo-hydrolase [Planctomycetota bacterium]